MGILDKIFGTSSNEDDKYVIFMACSYGLAAADGEISDEESNFSGSYIASLPGMTEKRYNSIKERFTRESKTAVEKAKDLKEDEKIELINFLIGVAMSDGYFHGAEANHIAMLGVLIGLDPVNIINHIATNYEIDENEMIDSMENMKQHLKSQGINL